ncbi:MAG: hypothetical protein ACTSRE_09370 [Promethearchaeota archaeon]
MSEENIQMPEEVTPQRNKRLRWIDQARGFVMVYLVWTLALPSELTEHIPFLRFLFDHPDDTARTMNLFDIGTPAFLFIVGLSLSIAFWKYADKKGVGMGLLRVIFRFGFLFLVGYILELGQNGWSFVDLVKEKNIDLMNVFRTWTETISVLWWDVVLAIGFCALLALPFIFIKNPWIRTGVAYGWMIIYQVLLMTIPYFRVYAVQSIHGGIYGSLFTLTSVTVLGTALGDYMFSTKDPKKKQYTLLGIFGGANVALGIGLGFIPGMYWNKEMNTLTFGLVSIGIITLGCLVFILMDEKLDWKLNYLVMFGMNPLFSYLVAELLFQLPGELFSFPFMNELWFKLVTMGAVIVVVSLLNWLLWRKKKRVRTEWVTFAFLILIVALSFVI